MSLRRRLALISATCVALAVMISAIVCYLVMRDQLRGQVDTELRDQATLVEHGAVIHGGGDVPGIPASSGGPAPYIQAVFPNGQTAQVDGNLTLPVTRSLIQLAAGNGSTMLSDVHVGSTHLRVIAVSIQGSFDNQPPQPMALELARPLNGIDRILANLRLVLYIVMLGGIALAAALGRLAGRRVLSPLAEVAATADVIGETDDLSRRIHVRADDEVGQLATRFNVMLDRLQASRSALDESMRAQRQLVADASHELRTPVTSLRTNIEVMLENPQLDPEDRRRLLADVVEQSEELTALVSDLIELARGDQPDYALEDVRLDAIAAASVARARRNAPGIHFDARLEAVSIDGVPARLERAINNLLDNAARHSPAGGTVEITVDREGVTVRDHGTGVPEADLPFVFDRFFRGSSSRGRQGSGLGLAIVRQVTEQHGGSVQAANAPDGGAVFSLRLPVTAAPAQAPSTAVPA